MTKANAQECKKKKVKGILISSEKLKKQGAKKTAKCGKRHSNLWPPHEIVLADMIEDDRRVMKFT